MSTNLKFCEFFAHSIHIYGGQKLLGPRYTIVKGMDGMWIGGQDRCTHVHKGERTFGTEDTEWSHHNQGDECYERRNTGSMVQGHLT